MIRALRTFSATVAILAILLTAGIVGGARGQAMAAGEIVICSGEGIVTIAVDADGNPTGPAHWCPDCVLALLAGLPAAPSVAELPEGMSVAVHAPVAGGQPGRSLPAPQARGPPSAA